jgi:hypothetical protein
MKSVEQEEAVYKRLTAAMLSTNSSQYTHHNNHVIIIAETTTTSTDTTSFGDHLSHPIRRVLGGVRLGSPADACFDLQRVSGRNRWYYYYYCSQEKCEEKQKSSSSSSFNHSQCVSPDDRASTVGYYQNPP